MKAEGPKTFNFYKIFYYYCKLNYLQIAHAVYMMAYQYAKDE